MFLASVKVRLSVTSKDNDSWFRIRINDKFSVAIYELFPWNNRTEKRIQWQEKTVEYSKNNRKFYHFYRETSPGKTCLWNLVLHKCQPSCMIPYGASTSKAYTFTWYQWPIFKNIHINHDCVPLFLKSSH